MTSSLDLPTIPEWFRGSRVLITGGSGFMGKVLVEKLLRSCPEVDTIYLLLRPKKGKQPSSRIQDITDLPLFKRLRHESPEAINKLVAVSGDVKELGLGLSDADRRLLQQQVDVVFHSAASVRFDDPLRDAVLINVRGTREVLNLALGMDKLKVFLHVSTTYCNCDQPEVGEQLYAPPGDWRTMISMAEDLTNDGLLRCLTPKILGKLPNTYTYAKALSEQVINDFRDRVPVVIVRPSIVISTHDEPVPGWIDNFNGPAGLMVGGAKGVLRSVYADPNNYGDYVPVDVAIKSIIYIAWHRALVSAPDSLPIYNCCSMTDPMTLFEVIDLGKVINRDIPVDNIFWYPNPTITYNMFTHYLKVLFYHMLPAMIVDMLLHMSGKKPMLARIQRKIYIANMALRSFIIRDFVFHNQLFLRAQDAMLPGDVTKFGYNKVLDDRYDYMRANSVGGRTYLLREKLEELPQALKHSNRMYWLDRIVKTTFKIGSLWIVLSVSMALYYNTLRPAVDSLQFSKLFQ